MRNPLAETERWFHQAEFDLKAGRHAARGEFYFAACFHAPQAAEKALKACRYAQGAQVVVGYSVYRLAQECRSTDVRFDALARDCGRLDMFYIPTRYPNGLPDSIPAEVYTAAEATLALDLAQQVLKLVADVLGLSFSN